MPDDLPPDLLAAVNDQAAARVAMNVQGYAGYLTPAAIDSLRGSFRGLPPRVSGYEIVTQEALGADYVIDVRYSARSDSFVVRSRWTKQGERWMVADAERLWAEGESRPGLLSRLLASVLGFFVRSRRPQQRP